MSGNETKEIKVNKDGKSITYIFEKEQCRNCSNRQACMGSTKTIAKRLHVSVNAPQYYKYSQESKTEEFKEEYKKRSRIEGKNGEMKRFHGLARARGYGLRSVSIQTKLTAIAVNLKKIAKLISSKIFIFLVEFIENSKKILLANFDVPNKIFLSDFFSGSETSPVRN